MIDCDVHCTPGSWEALEPYLEPSWRQFAQNGKMPLSSAFGDDSYPPQAPTSARQDVREVGGPIVPATYEVLEEQLLGPSSPDKVILNCLTMFDTLRNPYYQAALATAINDWLRNEWLERDPRLRASIVVPYANVEAAASEIARVGIDSRFVQVLLPIRADALWGQKAFAPIHAAAAEHGVAIALHAWGLNGHSPTPSGRTTTYVEDYLSNATIVQQHVVNFVAEGVFVRHPSLKVALVECGFNWLPSLFWRMDKHWKSFWPEIPWVKQQPSRYVRRNMAATIAPAELGDASPEQIREFVDIVGPSWLMYASDFPHDHGRSGERLLAALDDEKRAAVIAGNAASFYERGVGQGS